MARKPDEWELTKKDADAAVAKDKYQDDCLPCKVLGSSAFIGLGGYVYYTGMKNLRANEREIMRSASKYKMHSRQLGIVSISTMLVGLGIYRALH